MAGLAIAIGDNIDKGTSQLNLRTFFNVTSLVLIVFAAGLLVFTLAGYLRPTKTNKEAKTVVETKEG